MNSVWTDQAILRVSVPEGSKSVVALPPESGIPIEAQTQAGRAGLSIGQLPGTPAVDLMHEGEAVRKDNASDDTEFDIPVHLEFDEEDEVLEVEEAEAARELQGKAIECHQAKDRDPWILMALRKRSYPNMTRLLYMSWFGSIGQRPRKVGSTFLPNIG
jgi:hypothetical protein